MLDFDISQPASEAASTFYMRNAAKFRNRSDCMHAVEEPAASYWT